jgi:serine/threonine protein kinase
VPKIADFGLSRLLVEGKTHITTQMNFGTRWVKDIHFTERFIVNQGYIYFFSCVSRDIISVHACRGYMAPEYINNGKITFKSDIYSLGVIIRDLVMGRYNDATSDLDVCWKRNIYLPIYIGRVYSVASYKISYSIATFIYDNFIY